MVNCGVLRTGLVVTDSNHLKERVFITGDFGTTRHIRCDCPPNVFRFA